MQDRQQLLDYVIDELRDMGVAASWRESKRLHDRRSRWRGYVQQLRAHRAATGALPQSGEAVWWLARTRWRKRSLKLKDLLWLDTELPGWDADGIPVRARRLARAAAPDKRDPNVGAADRSRGRRLRRKTEFS